MSIDINKELEKYSELTAENKREPFRASDLENIYNASMLRGKTDTINAISNALAIGYSVGYKHAYRDLFDNKR